MKNISIAIIIIMIFFIPLCISAQHRWGENERGGRPRSERLEKFHKMRLIEVLNLNEEESVRFFAKQNTHEDKVHEFMSLRNEALDSIEANIKDNANTVNLEKKSSQIRELDKEIFNERQRFQDEVKQMLTPVQYGKFLVFERNFGRQVRDAIQEMNQEKRNSKPE